MEKERIKELKISLLREVNKRKKVRKEIAKIYSNKKKKELEK